MATLKAKDVESSLLKKGFARDNSHHRLFWFYHNGAKKQIRTRTSHDDQDVVQYLQAKMASQMHLTKKEFMAFVSCTISEENYIKLMTERGHL